MKLTLKAYCIYKGNKIIDKGLTNSTNVATNDNVAQFKGEDCEERMEKFIKIKNLAK